LFCAETRASLAGMRILVATALRLVMALLGVGLWSLPAAAQLRTDATVELLEPIDGERIRPGTDLTLRAGVGKGIEEVRQIEFVVDGKTVGVVSNTPYSMVWSNVQTGSYDIRVRVIPEIGLTVESRNVHVRVYSARLTFGLDRVGLLENHKLLGIPIWQYVASLIYIFLAFYVSKILDLLTRVWLTHWAKKTKSDFDDLLLGLLNGPIKIVAFVVFLRIGLEVFSWPTMMRSFLPKAFTIVVALSFTYMVLKFVDLVMSYWKQRTRADGDRAFDEQLFPIIRKSLKVFVIVVAILVTLDNIGVNITAAVASLSIGGLAIGLAAQDTLANLFGAVAVFADKPFRIGDTIQIDSMTGTVESIGMRSTRVRNPDGHLITVPNKTMGNATIVNISRRPNIKTVMNLGVTQDTSIKKLRQALGILEEIFRGNPKTRDVLITFNKFAESSLNIEVVHWWDSTDQKEYLAGVQDLNLKVKERFDAEGIELAFPSRTVYLEEHPNGEARKTK
jgi:MscS family membrane protein